MESILLLNESNCRNCYKCIRNCPVKSIRFQDGHAEIIESDCILCGRCYAACPQNAKEIRNDVAKVKELLAGDVPVYCSVAPSFVGAFELTSFASMEKALQDLGFAGAAETAEGASVVKKEFEKLLETKSLVISSCCSTINSLIEKYTPGALPYLAPVKTPMQTHCQMLKERYPGAKVVFVGPCISKKKEGEDPISQCDCVLTFDELSHWMEESGVAFDKTLADETAGGRSRFFPGTGGVIRSMDLAPEKVDYISADGIQDCMDILREIEEGGLKNCFVELNACRGGCISGPVMEHLHKRKRLQSTKAVERFANPDADFDLPQPDSRKIARSFSYEGIAGSRPGTSAIEEVLRKMGKNGPEDELNCGSCGYGTCREKAIAVLEGKADMNMCLPYLKEKAESFSDTILNNTPNGIFVLNEMLEIQQINSAALQLFNVKRADAVLETPVVRILDPSDYMNVLVTGKNCYNKRVYLAEYDKYVEQTIVYDKDYHILVCILRDVTAEEKGNLKQSELGRQTIEITDKVIDKQMRVVQEIASLLGETTAETKIALTKLKETLR